VCISNRELKGATGICAEVKSASAVHLK